MTDRTRALLHEALKLSTAERAVLIAELAATLPAGEEQDAVDEAWRVEIQRRARAVLRGEGTSSSWDEVEARIRDRLPRP
jgi:putative addiction module component (TIGR02574 family)